VYCQHNKLFRVADVCVYVYSKYISSCARILHCRQFLTRTPTRLRIHDVFLILISETEDKHRRARPTCKCVPLWSSYVCIMPYTIIYVHMCNMTYENTLFYFVFRARTIRYVILYNIIINRRKSIFPYSKRRIYREILASKEGQRRTFAANDLLCVWEGKKKQNVIFNRRYEYYYFTG